MSLLNADVEISYSSVTGSVFGIRHPSFNLDLIDFKLPINCLLYFKSYYDTLAILLWLPFQIFKYRKVLQVKRRLTSGRRATFNVLIREIHFLLISRIKTNTSRRILIFRTLRCILALGSAHLYTLQYVWKISAYQHLALSAWTYQLQASDFNSSQQDKMYRFAKRPF